MARTVRDAPDDHPAERHSCWPPGNQTGIECAAPQHAITSGIRSAWTTLTSTPACLVQVPAADAVAGLRPKILLNLGITLEAEGRLQEACDSYR